MPGGGSPFGSSWPPTGFTRTTSHPKPRPTSCTWWWWGWYCATWGGEGTHWTAKRSPFVPELVLDRLRRLQDLDEARRREAAGSVVDPRTTRFLLWSIVAVCATTVVSHELTPFALIAVVGVLVLARRLSGWSTCQ